MTCTFFHVVFSQTYAYHYSFHACTHVYVSLYAISYLMSCLSVSKVPWFCLNVWVYSTCTSENQGCQYSVSLLHMSSLDPIHGFGKPKESQSWMRLCTRYQLTVETTKWGHCGNKFPDFFWLVQLNHLPNHVEKYTQVLLVIQTIYSVVDRRDIVDRKSVV